MNEGGPLNFDLIACSVENLNHEMKEIRLSQIRRGLFCELDSTNGTAEIIKEKVLLKKVSFITFYVTFTSHHLNSGQVRYSQRSGVSTVQLGNVRFVNGHLVTCLLPLEHTVVQI